MNTDLIDEARRRFRQRYRRWAAPLVDSLTLPVSLLWFLSSVDCLYRQCLLPGSCPYTQWAQELRSLVCERQPVTPSRLSERASEIWAHGNDVCLEQRAVSRAFGAYSYFLAEDHANARSQAIVAFTNLVLGFEDAWHEDRLELVLSVFREVVSEGCDGAD